MRDGRTECELKLWDLASGRDLVTWPVSGGRPMGLAFDPDGHRLRVLLSGYPTLDARVVLFDAAPLAPEVEAIDLVDRLTGETQLNSELAANVEAEPGLDPAVRAAALEVISRRQENCAALMEEARYWLGVAAAERTPELMRRALAYAERAAALVADLNAADLATLGEARYRNGQLAECLAPLRQCLTLREQDQAVLSEERFLRALAFIAMAEAKLGHRALAQAALDDYRARRARELAGSKAKPPDDPLLAEAEAVLSRGPRVPPGRRRDDPRPFSREVRETRRGPPPHRRPSLPRGRRLDQVRQHLRYVLATPSLPTVFTPRTSTPRSFTSPASTPRG